MKTNFENLFLTLPAIDFKASFQDSPWLMLGIVAATIWLLAILLYALKIFRDVMKMNFDFRPGTLDYQNWKKDI